MKKIILTAICGSVVLAGCSKKPEIKYPPRHVNTLVVHSFNVPYQFDYPGTVQGVADYPVIPRVSGALFKQLYKEGSYVKKGQPLFQIDPRPFQAQLAADQGQLDKDFSSMVEYKKILDRDIVLLKVGGVSQQDVDTATISYKTSAGMVATERATIANDKLNLQYCTVAAPVDGLSAERLVTPGTMVTAYQTALTNINSNTDLYINFSVPENDRLELQKGIASGKVYVPKGYQFNVSLQLADGSMINNAGTVNFFDTRISLQNGTWNMRANIDNKKIGNQLLSGQFVHIYLAGASFTNTFAIPQSAVYRDNAGAFVYVLASGDTVKKQPVTTGAMIGEMWIINSGLTNGDKLITDGGMKVTNGEKVIVDQTTTQSDKIVASSAQ